MLTDQLLALGGALSLMAGPSTGTVKPTVITPPPFAESQSAVVVVYPPEPAFAFEDSKVGTGKAVDVGDRVNVHFIASDANSGDSLANTKLRGLPYEFVVVKEGDLLSRLAVGMKAGGTRVAVLGPELLNDGQGLPPIIPARRSVRIEIRLLSVNPKGSR